jgi:replicative DNA helicase
VSESSWDKAPLDLKGAKVITLPEVGFRSFGDRLETERQDRIDAGKRVLSFGVQFLNQALGGIFSNDLILIGAKTGVGKTALASSIALANARKGKRVHYFALEAEDREIERRIKFQLVSEIVRKAVGPREAARLNFLDWYLGKVDDVTGRFEAGADKALAETFKSLSTFYRTTEFYAEHFEAMVGQIEKETDLIILDHLHYVDSEDTNENRGYKLVVKKIRDVALRIGKPVVVVAHVRKTDRKASRLVPDTDDFHGTSDVPKIATKAIMLAPAFDQTSTSPSLWMTYVHPVKCRFDGARTRYVGLLTYDARANAYNENFLIGKLTAGGDKWECTPSDQIPEWAKTQPKGQTEWPSK